MQETNQKKVVQRNLVQPSIKKSKFAKKKALNEKGKKREFDPGSG